MSHDAVLGELLSDARGLVRQLLDEPPLDDGTLSSQLDAFASKVRLAADDYSLADWQTGLDLVTAARGLLRRWSTLDHRGRRLVQVGVRYLVLEDDGDDDLGSPFGFDDDREVLDAVLRALDGPGG